MPALSEPARGPQLDLSTHDPLPPFDRSAAVALFFGLLPLLNPLAIVGASMVGPIFGGATASGFAFLFWIPLSLASMVGPIVAIIVGGRVVRRLRHQALEDRPRGLAMAATARVIGWLTILLWIGVIVLIPLVR